MVYGFIFGRPWRPSIFRRSYELPSQAELWTLPFMLSYVVVILAIALALGLWRRLPGVGIAGAGLLGDVAAGAGNISQRPADCR